MSSYKDWKAFQKSYDLSMKIFLLSKQFPVEERFSLTDQVRRSSRSVCANIAEAYRRRRYKDYFISKLNDAETENTETEVWIEFSKDCNYISELDYKELLSINTEIGKLIWYMINNPEKFR